jgi:hypothetical protein
LSLISIAYLAMVIVAFCTLGVSLFAVQLYVNAKGKPGKAPAPEIARSEAAAELRRAA